MDLKQFKFEANVDRKCIDVVYIPDAKVVATIYLKGELDWNALTKALEKGINNIQISFDLLKIFSGPIATIKDLSTNTIIGLVKLEIEFNYDLLFRILIRQLY